MFHTYDTITPEPVTFTDEDCGMQLKAQKKLVRESLIWDDLLFYATIL